MLNEIIAQRERESSRECLACSTSVYIYLLLHLSIPSEMISMAVSRAITTRKSGTPQLVDSHLRTLPLTLLLPGSSETDLKLQAANFH